MTFNVFSAGQKVLASAMMQNFRHLNYGGPLLPVAADGSGVNNTIDLGSATYKFKDGYFKGFIYGTLREQFGDGADGSVSTTGNVTLGGYKSYVDYTLNSGHTLTIDSSIKFLVMCVSGTLTIVGNITGVGVGGAGGSGGSTSVGGAGSAGYGLAGSGGSGGRDGNAGGIGGPVNHIMGVLLGGIPTGGSTGTAGNTQPAPGYFVLNNLIGYGSGGGGGGDNGGGDGRAGGAGGGGLLIIANNLVITGTPTISCAGAAGTGGGASGGGGGGGSILIRYKNLTGSIPTLNVSGGAGGVGSATQDGGAGGSGYSAAIAI